MRHLRLALATVLAPFHFLATTAGAQLQVHSAPISSPVLTVPWTHSFTLPKFDPALGHLTLVQLYVTGSVAGSLGIENTGATQSGASPYIGANVGVGISGTFWLPANAAYEVYGLTLPAFDGTLDYAGTSGTTHVFSGAYGTGAPSNSLFVYAPHALEFFRGPEGAPGTMTMDVLVSGLLGNAFPPIDAQGSCAYSGTFEVRYHYTEDATAICTTQASSLWGNCPCGNAGTTTSGCGNSVVATGASLGATGAASISGDTLTLVASNMPNSSAIFLQGNDLTDAPTFLGDGLRCVDGNLIRLGTSAIVGGSASYPSPVQLSISVRGGVVAPGTRYYQAYYRNAAAFCTPETFNVTSGIALRWGP
jgi:hypothetical protein